MSNQTAITRDLRSGLLYTILLFFVFVFYVYPQSTFSSILSALPFVVILYFIFFTLGRYSISERTRQILNQDIRRIILFPLFLIILFYTYLFFHGANPLKGTLFLVPYLLFFPVLAFSARDNTKAEIDWFDFAIFFLFFFPVTLVSVKPAGNLPFDGVAIDSFYRISVMLIAIFAFVMIRKIQDAGIYPVFNWRFLFTTFWVWIAFYIFVFLIGYSVHFIKLSGSVSWNIDFIEKIIRNIISVFFHTALFEELIFRGLLQNMMHKRISQSTSWKIFWGWGGGVLLALALITGYAMKGNMNWFPALVTAGLFAGAWVMEKSGRQATGSYTAMAITSVVFGLVHFHTGSIIFTGLAAIGGWAYGYVYMKTKNTFYSALLHALVNSSALIFGLELAK